jgi:actin-related protein 6
LPDFQAVVKGFVKADDEAPLPGEQVLVMETERMSVPELLFHPTDIGLEQAGVVEATAQALGALPLVQRGFAGSQVVLTGGNVNLPNLAARYARELRSVLPDLLDIEVVLPARPEHFAWQGAHRLVSEVSQRQHAWRQVSVSKQQYEECGHERCNRFFESHW